jgi:hypothetical protein
VERFLLDNYKPHQLSTYALTLYRHDYKGEDGKVTPVGEHLNSVITHFLFKAMTLPPSHQISGTRPVRRDSTACTPLITTGPTLALWFLT